MQVEADPRAFFHQSINLFKPRNRVSSRLSEAEKHDDFKIRDRRVDIKATTGKGSNVPGPGRGTRGPGHDDDDDDRLVVKP